MNPLLLLSICPLSVCLPCCLSALLLCPCPHALPPYLLHISSFRSPALTVKSVIMSLISMLHSAAARARPPDDLRYCGAYPASANPKNTRFLFDDDAV
jgi:hypothetical protein